MLVLRVHLRNSVHLKHLHNIPPRVYKYFNPYFFVQNFNNEQPSED